MILLKNKRAWKKWAKAFNSSQPQSLCSEPEQYPCFVYTVVQSFGMEEEREIYLTGKDLTRMAAQLVQAKYQDEFTIKEETHKCRLVEKDGKKHLIEIKTGKKFPYHEGDSFSESRNQGK